MLGSLNLRLVLLGVEVSGVFLSTLWADLAVDSVSGRSESSN